MPSPEMIAKINGTAHATHNKRYAHVGESIIFAREAPPNTQANIPTVPI
jgi:hypothetical protein